MNVNKFLRKFPEVAINSFRVSDLENIVVTEYAPEIFRQIRSNIISEKDIYESFIPSDNYAAMANFQTGQGKSPSFFFFSENKLVLLKTMK